MTYRQQVIMFFSIIVLGGLLTGGFIIYKGSKSEDKS